MFCELNTMLFIQFSRLTSLVLWFALNFVPQHLVRMEAGNNVILICCVLFLSMFVFLMFYASAWNMFFFGIKKLFCLSLPNNRFGWFLWKVWVGLGSWLTWLATWKYFEIMNTVIFDWYLLISMIKKIIVYTWILSNFGTASLI